MTTPTPEAENEYSRGRRTSRRAEASRPAGVLGRFAVPALAVLGAVLLVAAELSPLYSVHVNTSDLPVGSVSTGSHNAYALIPLALLAGLLVLAALRGAGAVAWPALVALGVITLLIMLFGDLPDTHAHGITPHLALASASAARGLYLETLGGVLLLLAGGLGVLRTGIPGPRVELGAARRLRALGHSRSGS